MGFIARTLSRAVCAAARPSIRSYGTACTPPLSSFSPLAASVSPFPFASSAVVDARRATSPSSRALHNGVPLASWDEGANYRKLLGSHALPRWEDEESEEGSESDEEEEEYDYSTLSHIAREKRKDFSHPTLAEELLESGLDIQGFEMRVMNINRTCKSTKAGGLTRYSALVMCGNRKGLVGYALSKGPEPHMATEKAYRLAYKNLYYFDLFDGHTIWHPVTAYFGATKVIMMPGQTGSGLRCNRVITNICELAGIKNLRAKVHGSHHVHNTMHAAFKALHSITSPEELSDLRGRHVEYY